MVKFNPKMKIEVEKYKDYVIIVEGKKDIASMQGIGFEKVYAIHEDGVSLRERVEQIAEQLDRRNDKVCILTDFDKKGKQLYMHVKPIFLELGIKLDSSLRGLLIKLGLSHIEGIYKFMEQVDGIG